MQGFINFLRFFLLVILLLAAVAGAFALWVWSELNEKVGHSSATTVTVRKGASVDEVIRSLNESGIVETVLPLKIYVKLRKPLIRSGRFSFPSPITPMEAIDVLERGGGEFMRLTVIEGWTRWEIADALAKQTQFALDKTTAMKLLENTALIKDLDPNARNLEGYLFPDTYFIEPDTTADALIKGMVSRFRQIWDSKLKQEATWKGKSVHEVVTIASIIETECKLNEERPLVASVIENRIRKRMPLSMDSTVVYASKMAGTWRNDGKVYLSDVNRDSPYNTRKYIGLPPGPVGSPGLSSLQAALNPASTNFLFYVRNPDRVDGAHNFYATPEQFEIGVRALRNWEQKQIKSTPPAVAPAPQRRPAARKLSTTKRKAQVSTKRRKRRT